MIEPSRSVQGTLYAEQKIRADYVKVGAGKKHGEEREEEEGEEDKAKEDEVQTVQSYRCTGVGLRNKALLQWWPQELVR